ncbi:hypothetical protein BDF14DRAFT_408359 [Spinellus fusiger]|nr:hypothetical protein BDF14DRAFT_408359 [Spinellus fusiger]
MSPLTTTSNPSSSSSPTSSLSRGQSIRLGTEPLPIVCSQLEELMRMNETQRQILQDICGTLGGKNKQLEPRKPANSKYVDGVELRSTSEEMSTFHQLQHLLQISMRDNLVLQRENDALRRELELLRSPEDGKCI